MMVSSAALSSLALRRLRAGEDGLTLKMRYSPPRRQLPMTGNM